METIEQLKQENEKLNARLAKAVEVFKEQKANIEAVTKERDDLQEKYDDVFEAAKNLGLEIAQLKAQIHEQENIVDQDATINELRNEIESKNKAYKILQDTYNELYGDNIKLKEQLEQRLKQVRAVENTTNEEVKKVTIARDEWIEKYRKLETQYKEQEKFDSEVINVKVPELEEQLRIFKQKFEEEGKNCVANKVALDEANKTIESKDQAYKVLQDTYDKVFTELNELKETNTKNINAYEDLENEYDKLNKSYNDLEHDFNLEEENHKKTKQLKEGFEESCEALNKTNLELSDKLVKLNKLYDNLENEKLAYASELESLQKKYDEKVMQEEVSSEFETGLTNTLHKIWELCDDILNPVAQEIKNSKAKKPNIINKSNNSTGSQFMSDAPGMNI